MKRRSFLKGLAAAPVAAIVPVAAVAAETISPIEAVEVSKYPWKWWVGSSEEYFDSCFNSMKDAVEHAEYSMGGGYIIEAKQGDYDLSIDASDILERLYSQNSDLMNEDGDFIDCTKEQEKDLSEMLTRTMHEWVQKHGIKTTAWAFTSVRNEEYIEEKEDI